MRALTLAAEGIHIAREAGDFDLEMLGRDVQGLALVGIVFLVHQMSVVVLLSSQIFLLY